MKKLGRFSIGVGDRFGHQGEAQIAALELTEKAGVVVVPVWNKSNREHTLIGTEPAQTRQAADAAVAARNWKHQYFLDADHVGLKTVDRFIDACDFFTLDVADDIGQPAEAADIDAFVARWKHLVGTLTIPGLSEAFTITEATLRQVAGTYLRAAKEAGKIYRHIAAKKDPATFVVEVSMDETMQPQTPLEMFLILAALSEEKIPVQTVAPKFSGKFLKGIDYVGSVERFAAEFEADVRVVAHAAKLFGLPETLKLSVHSGSDKFSLYPVMRSVLQKTGAGVHLKTAGTTWLEELIGLAAAGGDGLAMAKKVYADAIARMDELTKPYATVVEIDKTKLPTPAEVSGWTSDQYAHALRHVQSNPAYNLHFRQVLHVAFKLAGEMGTSYTDMLKKYRSVIGANVTENLYERHLKPLFVGA